MIEREQVLELLAPTIVHQESANKFFEKGLHPIACSLHDGLFSIQVRRFRVMSSPLPAASTRLHQHRQNIVTLPQGTTLHPRLLHLQQEVRTSRETTFDPARNLDLVPIFFAPETRETFSPGL